MPPRTEEVTSETITRASDVFELEIRFPGGVRAGDAKWSLEGDVLEVEHAGLHPPYHRAFLVPSGWDLDASVQDGDLRIRLAQQPGPGVPG